MNEKNHYDAESHDDYKSLSVRELLRPLAPFFKDELVTEIRLNRPNEVVTVGMAGKEFHDVAYGEDRFRALATALEAYNSLPNAPINYVVLPNGERGTMVRYPAVTTTHHQFAFRKHMATTIPFDELEGQGTFDGWRDVSFNRPSEEEVASYAARHDVMRLTPDDVELLSLLRARDLPNFIKRAILLRKNIVVSGKTGSGKTTFIRSCIDVIPRSERIITLEDVHELVLPEFPEAIHLLYGKREGRVPIGEAMELCMRMSPDRIFPAELRGGEAWDYLKALNNGHPGSLTTAHSNGAVEGFSRIAMLIKDSAVGQGLDMDTIRRELYATVDVSIFMKNRKVVEVFFDPINARKHMA